MENKDENRVESPYLRLERVTKHFGPTRAVDDVTLDVREGEFVCILGPSGCGKTTLLRIIAGLEEQDAGRVFLGGRDISALPTSQRRCGIVFQSYALFPNLTAQQNVAYGMRCRGLGRKALRERVAALLDMVGLGDIGHKYPAHLSGGQQQRVALARALAVEPALLLLDEPLSALDARVRLRLRGELRALQQRLRITTVMVTHDQEEALAMADRVVVMSDGQLVQYARPEHVYHGPSDTFVADFIGSMNFLRDWRRSENGCVAHPAGHVLSAAGHRESDPSQPDVIVAIRPEDVRCRTSDNGRLNCLPVRVESLEFRGATYRLRATVLPAENEQANVPSGLEPLCIDLDMPYDEVERSAIAPGVTLLAELPPERLILFSEEASAVHA